MTVAGVVIEVVLYLFLALMLVRMVAGFVMMLSTTWSPTGGLMVTLELVFTATDPPIVALRKVVPPLRIGGASLDVAGTLVFFIALALLTVNRVFLLG